MLTLRQTIYSLVAAGSLLMAGAQALGSDDEPIEESAIGLGQAGPQRPADHPAPTLLARLEARPTS